MGSQTMTIHIKAQLAWSRKRLQSGAWIAVCDALGLTVEANDEAELRSMIAETHHFLFLDLFQDGELDRFLRDRGWATSTPMPAPSPESGVRFEVPFELRPWSHANA